MSRPRGGGVLILGLLGAGPVDAQVADPIPERIARSGIAAVIEDHLVLPPSSDAGARARINHLRYAPDGSDREFVNDLRGRLHVVRGGAVTTYLDLSARMSSFADAPGLGSGFGSFAFHPDFASNGLLYTVHTERAGAAPPGLTGPATIEPVMHGVITEWRADDPSADAFSGARREVLRIEFPGVIHGIQEITFNPFAGPGAPDYGLLYVGVGEGGSVARGLADNSGRLDSPLGTVLRIDPRGVDSESGAYGIPPDNPWASDGDPETLGEIWALGFRNPTRLSWDPGGRGAMLISDIGEDNIEEIDLGVAGAHYGFPRREGTFRFDPGDRRSAYPLADEEADASFTGPVAQYDHDEGRAVVGGHVYRGSRISGLVGHYVFGDIPTGRVFHFDVADLDEGGPVVIEELSLTRPDGTATTLRELVGANRVDLHFGVDRDGELYVLTKADGAVRRLTGQASRITVRPAPTAAFEDEWRADGGGWDLSDGVLSLATAATPGGPVRRPGAIALLRDRRFGRVTIEAEVRSTADPTVVQADMLLVFGYRSPTRFYYAHLSGVTDAVHNGIFLVDGSDRRRIDDGSDAPQLADRAWHRVRLEHDPLSGRIEVYVDGAATPGLTAVDRTFAGGEVGFGSFDDTGLVRDIVIRGAIVPRGGR